MNNINYYRLSVRNSNTIKHRMSKFWRKQNSNNNDNNNNTHNFYSPETGSKATMN